MGVGTMEKAFRFIEKACWLVLLHTATVLAAQAKPIKVFLLAGQSNMVGMGSIEHLHLLINASSTNPYRAALWNGTGFNQRNDVYFTFTSTNTSGRLTVGEDSGFAGKNRFGPEVMFGWTVGDYFLTENETIVLIKAAYGGRNLAIDLRPPSSGEGHYPGVKPMKYGWEYRTMIGDFMEALDRLQSIVPSYNDTVGYQLSGFVWFQGWNDMLDWEYVSEYGFNLANFIRDVRLDLGGPPDLPFVVGELGMHGTHPQGEGADRILAMRAAQLRTTQTCEFRSTTLFVKTSQYAILNQTTYDGIYHYFGRADTYFHIGEAFGRGMLKLLANKKISCESGASRAYFNRSWFSSKDHVVAN